MSFKGARVPLQDILDAIALIEQFTTDMSFEEFRVELKTVAAVERKLQLISEAAIRLGDDAETICPGPPWRSIRGMGNWLRHQYDRIDVETVWNTLRRSFAQGSRRGCPAPTARVGDPSAAADSV